MKPTPEKLKIAMLGHKRIPSNEGGVEVVVEALCARMAALGHSVTCYNRAGHHVSGAEHELPAGSVYRGIRLVTVPTLERKGFAAKFIHMGERSAVRFADEIIVLSENVRQYFLDTYGRATRFIPNGVSAPTLESPRLIADKWGLQKDGYILYLGRIVPEKGETYLIEAFKQVKTDKKLVIAGGSSDTERYLKQLQNLAAGDDRILFTGFVQGKLRDELYSNAYVYTLPSDLEGMPLSLLEAMSYGNCCLVSDIPECAEVVEDKAVLFRKSDVDNLRQKLQTLCDQPETASQYKANAAQFILNKYGWDDVVDKTLALYRR